MYFRQIQLKAFGKFTDHTLDFGDGPGLHVIYGPNEAGKSTTQRAIVNFLYGIPHRSRDGFLHSNTKLRIAATIVDSSGQEHSFIRRKGKQNTLLDVNDAVVDESQLQSLMAYIKESQYLSMFGLDRQRLESGAKELLEGKGDLGTSLFAAATGISHLQRLLADLEEEAQAIYRERGDKYPLNQALKASQEAKKRCENAGLSGETWKKHQRSLSDHEAAAVTLKEKRREIEGQLRKLERLKRARPLFDALKRCEVNLLTVEGVALIEEGMTDERISATVKLEGSKQRLEEGAKELAELEKLTKKLDYSTELLENQPLVESLFQRIGEYQQSGRMLDESKKRSQELSDKLAACKISLQNGDGQLDSKWKHRVKELRAAIAKFDQLSTLKETLIEERSKRDGICRELGLSIEDLYAYDFPAESSYFQLEETEEGLKQEQRRLTRRQATLAARTQALMEEESLVTERDLLDVRQERDKCWQAIKSGQDCFQAFEEALLKSDEVVDCLRLKAERVAKLSELRVEERSCAAELEELAEQFLRVSAELSPFRETWPTGLSMQKWVESAKEALQRTDQVGVYEEQIAQLETELAGVRESLFILDSERDLSEWSLEALVSLLEERLDAERDRKAQQKHLGDLRDRLEESKADQERCEASLRGFDEDLAKLTAETGVEGAKLLHSQLRQALESQQSHRNLQERLQQTSKAQSAHRAQKQQAEDSLAALVARAGAKSIEELPDLERKSQKRRAWMRERDSLKEQLVALLEGETLEELASEASELEIEGLSQELEQLEEQRQALHLEITELDQCVGDERRALQAMEAQAAQGHAAEAALDRECYHADIRQLARRYATLQTAARLLRLTMERYREKNQGPVLARASELFHRITCGSFEGLKLTYGEGDHPIIVAFRGDKELELDCLSSGTAEQLYLALRLASIESYVQEHQPVPILLDDTLLDSDADRSEQILEVLEELGTKTQVLLFTHHAHLVDRSPEGSRTLQLA